VDNDRKMETFENLHFPVTPAKAGVQNTLKTLDSGFRRNDDGESETVFFKGLKWFARSESNVFHRSVIKLTIGGNYDDKQRTA